VVVVEVVGVVVVVVVVGAETNSFKKNVSKKLQKSNLAFRK
jgi:hypothetical protein